MYIFLEVLYVCKWSFVWLGDGGKVAALWWGCGSYIFIRLEEIPEFPLHLRKFSSGPLKSVENESAAPTVLFRINNASVFIRGREGQEANLDLSLCCIYIKNISNFYPDSRPGFEDNSAEIISLTPFPPRLVIPLIIIFFTQA